MTVTQRGDSFHIDLNLGFGAFIVSRERVERIRDELTAALERPPLRRWLCVGDLCSTAIAGPERVEYPDGAHYVYARTKDEAITRHQALKKEIKQLLYGSILDAEEKGL